MEQVMSQPGAFDQASVDDHWIIDQLLGIIHLERKLDGVLSKRNGQIDESVCREMAALTARVARFDKILDCRQSGKPVSRVRAS